MAIELNRWGNTAQDRDFRNNTNKNWETIENTVNPLLKVTEETAKRSSGVVITLGSSTPFPNIDTVSKTITLYKNFYITCGKTRYSFDQDVVISFITTAVIQYLVFNTVTNTFRFVAGSAEASIKEDEIIIMTFMFNKIGDTADVKQVFSTIEYTINGKGSVTSNKRTPLGELGVYLYSASTQAPNIDTVSKTITFPANFWIYHRKSRYAFTNQVVVNYITTATNQYLLYDTLTNTFHLVASSNEAALSENEILIMIIGLATNGKIRNVFFTNNYTIDGKKIGNLVYKSGVISLGGSQTPVHVETSKITLTKPFYINTENKSYTFNDVSGEKVVINLIPGSTFQYIYYNPDVNEFKVLTRDQLVTVTSEDVFLMSITLNGSKVSYIEASCPITTMESVKEQNNKRHYFAPEEIGGIYNPTVTGLTNFNTVESLHAKLNELASKYPEYLTGKILGKDASNTFDIYQFHAKPAQISGDWLTKKLPKFIFTVGVHGGEKASTASFYYFIKDLCENWKSDPILEYIRWNTEIVFIPIANPWSFENSGTHGGRHNVNGVDLNRNQSYLWVANGAPGDIDYSGPSALSEVESQYIKKTIDDHKDAFFMSDYHTNGTSGSTYGDLMWHSQISGELGNENILVASKYLIEKLTRKYIKDYDLPSNKGLFGYMSSSNIGGSIKLYAASLGIKANTIECWKMFPTEQTPYSENTLKGCTDYIGNWVLALLRQFKNAK